MPWPPLLADLKDDLDVPDDLDDSKLQRRLDAAVAFVQRARPDAFVTDDSGVIVEPITLSERGERELLSLELGTLMLTQRLFARRRSQDAILWMAETGTTRLPWEDRDIERLLRIGRHVKPRVG